MTRFLCRRLSVALLVGLGVSAEVPVGGSAALADGVKGIAGPAAGPKAPGGDGIAGSAAPNSGIKAPGGKRSVDGAAQELCATGSDGQTAGELVPCESLGKSAARGFGVDAGSKAPGGGGIKVNGGKGVTAGAAPNGI